MIKIAICDDEENTRAYLSSLIQEQPCPSKVIEYASAGEYLADDVQIDLLFLDIALDPQGLDGMSLARKIRAKDLETQPIIIFVTGYEQYVFNAFDVGAFQYLLKPIDEEKFAQVFSRAAKQILEDRKTSSKVPTLTLRTANTTQILPLSNIDHIESSNHKVILHMKDGKLTYYARIRDLERELQGQFFRIHKGYLVNLESIRAYSKTEVTLTNGDKLQISKYKYNDFVKAYLSFLKKGVRL